MKTYYQALRENGMGYMVPKSTKSRRYSSSSYSPRQSSTAMQRSILEDHARYRATVPMEFAYGHSYKEAMQPMNRREFKAFSSATRDAFDEFFTCLDRLYFGSNSQW